jgi:hypothetical protein
VPKVIRNNLESDEVKVLQEVKIFTQVTIIDHPQLGRHVFTIYMGGSDSDGVC